MGTYSMAWPGLKGLTVYIIDRKGKQIYGPDYPLTDDLLYLNKRKHKYVDYNAVLRLFNVKDRPSAVKQLNELTSLSNVQGIFTVSFEVRSRERENSTVVQSASYLPVNTLLLFVFSHPKCHVFQMIRKEVLIFLDHFLESPCGKCGFLLRECFCGQSITDSEMVYIGYAQEICEKSVQTDDIAPDFHMHSPGNYPVPQPLHMGMPMGMPPGHAYQSQMPSPVNPMMMSPTYMPEMRCTLMLPPGVRLPQGTRIPMDMLQGGGAGGGLMYPPPPPPPMSRMSMMVDNAASTADAIKPSMNMSESGPGKPLVPPPPPPGPPPPGARLVGSSTSDANSLNKSASGNLLTVAPPVRPLPPPPPPPSLPPPPPPPPAPAKETREMGVQTPKNLPAAFRKMKSRMEKKQLENDRASLSSSKDGDLNKEAQDKILLEEKKDDLEEILAAGGALAMLATAASEFTRPGSKTDSASTQDNSSDRSGQNSVPPSPVEGGPLRFAGQAKQLKPNRLNWRLLDSDEESDEESERGKPQDSEMPSPDKSTGETSILGKDSSSTETKHAHDVNSSAAQKVTLSESDDKMAEKDSESNKTKIDSVEKVTESKSTSLMRHDSLDGSTNLDRMQLEGKEGLENNETLHVSWNEPGADTEGSDVEDPDQIMEDESQRELLMAAKMLEIKAHKEAMDAAKLVQEKEEAKDEEKTPEKTGTDSSGPSGSPGAQEETGEKSSIEIDDDLESEKKLVIDIKENSNDKPAEDSNKDAVKTEAETTETKTGSTPPVPAAADTKPDLEAELEKDGLAPTMKLRISKKDKLKMKNIGRFEYLPTGEKLFRCMAVNCGYTFETRVAAQVHDQVHDENNTKYLQCYKCEMQMPVLKWYEMVRHLRMSHDVNLTEKEHGCHLCGTEFDSEDKLTRHLEYHYNSKYKCIKCGIVLLSWKQVRHHRQQCPEKAKKESNLGCPYCIFVFHIRNMRNIHMMSHRDGGLICPVCQDGILWEHWRQLRKHYLSKHGRTVRPDVDLKIPEHPSCPRCELEFTNHDMCYQHMKRTHDWVPYILAGCTKCERTFNNTKTRDWHIKNAHGTEEKCSKCDYVAKSKMLLKLHQQKHAEKEHLCSECGKAFAHYHQLRIHLAQHARKACYPCKLCGEEFTKHAEMRQHVNSAHPRPSSKPMQQCEQCSYTCFSIHTLRMHIQKEHPKSGGEEEDDPDHCYFNKKVTPLPEQPPPQKRRRRTSSASSRAPPPPPPPKPERVSKRPYRRSSTKKPVIEKSDEEDYTPFPKDRTQRKQLKRQRKEREQRVKFLRKKTCARTRTYEDQKLMIEAEGGDIQNIGRMFTEFGQVRAARQSARRVSGQAALQRQISPKQKHAEDGFVNVDNELRYPYLDHSYFKMDGDAAADSLFPRQGRQRSASLYSDLDIVVTPEVSDFQECETDSLRAQQMQNPEFPRPADVFQRSVSVDLPLNNRKITTVKRDLLGEKVGVSISGRINQLPKQPRAPVRPHRLTFNPSSVDIGGLGGIRQQPLATSPVKVVRIVGGQVTGGANLVQMGTLGSPVRSRAHHTETHLAEDTGAANDLVQGADSGSATESEILEPDLMRVAEEFGTEQDMNLLKDILKSIQNSAATSPTSAPHLDIIEQMETTEEVIEQAPHIVSVELASASASTSGTSMSEISTAGNQNNSFGESVADSNAVLEDIDDIELRDVDYKLFQEGAMNLPSGQNGPRVIVEKAASLSPTKPIAAVVGLAEQHDPGQRKMSDHAYF